MFLTLAQEVVVHRQPRLPLMELLPVFRHLLRRLLRSVVAQN